MQICIFCGMQLPTTAQIMQLLAALVLAWHPGGLPCTCVIWQAAMDLGSLYSDLGVHTVICVCVVCVWVCVISP